jgi:YidC/Oxa1 family membrane protein insertase
MEQKRVIIAVVLCFLVLILWTRFFPETALVKPAPQNASTAQPKPAPAPRAETPVAPAQNFAPAQGQKVTVKTGLYTAEFNSAGGVLESFVLSKYRESAAPGSPNIDLIGQASRAKAPMGLIVDGQPSWLKAEWGEAPASLNLTGQDSGVLVFKGRMGDLSIERRLTFSAKSYLITEEVALGNAGAAEAKPLVSFTLAAKSLSDADDKYNPTRIASHGPKGLDEHTDRKALAEKGVQFAGAFDWASIQSNYFLLAMIPGGKESAFKAGLQDDIFRLAVDEETSIAAGQSRSVNVTYFFGPCEREILDAAPGNLSNAVDLGWFSFIAKPLLVLLVWLDKYTHNYGLAIIILTILIKLLFWPLSQKSYKSMDKMKKIQPMMAKLREKYGDDKEKLNQEMMALYKAYKVNPAGGCLPMIVQIPVFFGLYKALLSAIELRHAPFIVNLPFTDMIWLADLAAKDPYYITPLIMGATMLLQQKMTPAPGDPTQAKVMMFMPVIFTFLFLNFPSGLVVYWLVNNVLSIAQQWWMMRKPS